MMVVIRDIELSTLWREKEEKRRCRHDEVFFQGKSRGARALPRDQPETLDLGKGTPRTHGDDDVYIATTL